MSSQKIESIVTQKNISLLIRSSNHLMKLKTSIIELQTLATGKLGSGLTKENYIERMNEILNKIDTDEVTYQIIEQSQFTEEFNNFLCELDYNNKKIADL